MHASTIRATAALPCPTFPVSGAVASELKARSFSRWGDGAGSAVRAPSFHRMAVGTGANGEQERKSVLAEFRAFLLRGNVVDLAVAVVIGAASAAVIKSFVSDLVLPLVGVVFGTTDFSKLTFTVNGSVFRYGNFIDAVIGFVMIAAAIFFLVIKPTERLAAITGDRPEEGPGEVELLAEIRDLLRDSR